jgi:hypothetical protein
MAQAVTVFKYDDEGAPQIVDGKPSEYMTVLNKCLVEGYGDQVPLGWLTVLDEHLTSEPFLALKNDITQGGSGGTITLSALNDNDGTLTTVQCCQSFIDKRNLINVGSSFVYKRHSTNTHLLKNWMVIGTDTAFYFFVTSPQRANTNAFGTYPSILFFVGDFQSFFNNDPGRFITIASRSTDQSSHSWNHMLNSKVGYNAANDLTNIYPLDGGNSRVKHSINSAYGNAAYFGSGVLKSAAPDILSLAECFLFAGKAVNHHAAEEYLNSTSSPWHRGKVPGLCFSAQAGYTNVPMPHIKRINGANYFQIPGAHTSGSCAWINTEQWA